jgi:dihydroorotase/N-acyl-D-amino-acid deacylase
MGLKDRGIIEIGKKADITIFNPKTVIDNATFEKPHQYSKGIEYVIVNGKFAVDQGVFKAVKSGRVLLKY